MIGYVTLGTNNFDDAAKFYDELLGSIGAGRFMESDEFIAWATAPGSPAISITKPYGGKEALLYEVEDKHWVLCTVKSGRPDLKSSTPQVPFHR